ncbi:hypothetical protein IFM89_018185 [Coptis chinensis]|uniref:Uncharacterized protein n=1 Tax=Coptis chinensis TaxID=261450 RepID=A0A835I422_9MAGN|nr:hypothetical protein IFM89_018185 [Coptis chinensis]
MKKKKGSGISKTTYDKVADSFQKDGLLDDLDKLKGMYSNSQAENSMKQVASRISNVINEKDWFDFPNDVQQKILDINCIWSPELIKMVVEKVVGNPRKILLFFGGFKLLSLLNPITSYMIFVVKACGHEMEMETYSFVMLLVLVPDNASILDEVVKSLIGVEKVKECDKILKAMEKGGSLPSGELYNKIIYHLATLSEVKRF